MPVLNRDYYLNRLGGKPELLDSPVRLLQFGAGVFVRGFVEDFIHLANTAGHFSGGVAAVQRRSSTAASQLAGQDYLYTLCLRGLERGSIREEHRVITSLRRILFAESQWEEVLAHAADPQVQWIVSNTTEAGFELDASDRPDAVPPASFPAKLAACLWRRFRSAGAWQKLWMLPCELIDDNGSRLRERVLELAAAWSFPREFFDWLEEHTQFCNTLVDRIVTGVPQDEERRAFSQKLGYEDRQLITAECFHLFAIEAPSELEHTFPLNREAPNVRFASDISLYRLKKVRVLNGTHTAMTPVSFLAGNDTVRRSLEHPLTGAFVHKLVFEEIVPALGLPELEGRAYAQEVLDRFRNPFMTHPLLSIALNCTFKFRVRLIPTLKDYHQHNGRLPRALLFALAAHLLFLRGKRDGESYAIQDDRAAGIAKRWAAVDAGQTLEDFLGDVISDTGLWGEDLNRVPGLHEIVAEHLKGMRSEGMEAALKKLLEQA